MELTTIPVEALVEGDTFLHPGYENAKKYGDPMRDWIVRFHSLNSGFVWYDETHQGKYEGRYGLDLTHVQVKA